jgi:hypothetical protein
VSTRSARAGPNDEHVLAHGLRAARDLVGCLALDAQGDEERANLPGRRLAVHDRTHHVSRAVLRQVPPVHELGDRGLDHAPPGSSDQLGPDRRQHRLGVELDSVHGQLAVANGHDLAIRSRRGDLELVGHARRGERVVAARLELVGQPRKSPRRRARRSSPCRGRAAARADLAAERLDDRLVAEADAERRHAGEPLDDLDASPAPLGRPGPGETTRCDGASRSASSASISSFRRTTTSRPSSPNRCARL